MKKAKPTLHASKEAKTAVKQKKVVFDEKADCFDAMGLHDMAAHRQRMAAEESDVHKRARQKRRKADEKQHTEASDPPPPKERPPDDPPPSPPPPVRDKKRKSSTATALDGQKQGKPLSLMQPQPLADIHPFVPTLHDWQQGIRVDCGPEWDSATIEAAVDRGPHPSAMTPESIALFAEDIKYQVNAGFCKVVTWEELKTSCPSNLKISPVAVVPQADRRGRIILDLSFPVYQEVEGSMAITQPSVNDTTVITAPTIPVKEIGKVLRRLLYFMKKTRAGVWICFSKLDISDGFWRLVVRPEDSYNFAYVLPQLPGQPLRIVIPSALQMGWVESPSYFCTVTESARDITQHLLTNNVTLPHHPVEDMMTIPVIPPRARASSPSCLPQVYVDDFCNAATQSKEGGFLAKVRRASVHGVHALFPETCITNHANGKEPISRKKLDKGDGNFSTKKTMIGFEFNGITRTVRLQEDKSRSYTKEAHAMLRRKRIPIKTFQATVGKLRHAALILPAACGFFTPLNNILKAPEKSITLGEDAQAAVRDICTLIHQLHKRPTHVNELLPNPPSYVAYHDAAAEGAGGVWFSLVSNMQPLVWRVAFPQDIADEVRSDNNPTGSITNSDLELAAEVLAAAVMLAQAPVTKHVTLGTLCDNSPTVGWIERMASRSIFPTAGRLLRGLAYLLYTCRTGGIFTVHVPGPDNVMADIASRPAKALSLFAPTQSHLSDHHFCSSFDTAFPLPYNQVWKFASVPEWLKSNVFETLRGKRLDLQQWASQNGLSTGKHGSVIVDSTTQAVWATPPLTPATCSSLLLLPCGKVSTVSDVKSRFNQCPGLSEPSHKSTFWTDIETHEKLHPPSSDLISQ